MHDFLTAYPKKIFQKDEVVLSIGETPDNVFYIESGKVRQFNVKPNGAEITLNLYANPAIFSVSWAFGKVKNDFYFQAIETSTLHVVPSSDFEEYLLNNPNDTLQLISRLGRGLDAIIRRLDTHLSTDASRRIAVEVLIEIKRFSLANERQHAYIDMPINVLANRSGLARETASRQVSSLLQKNIIKKRKGRIYVPDILALEQYVNTP